MKPIIGLFLSLTILSIFFSMRSLHANEVAEKTAILTAGTWLSLVDAGNYFESWNQTAGFLKTAVTKEQWQNSMKGFRAPLGKVVARKMISTQYTQSLPEAPDGDYVVIQYETEFGKKEISDRNSYSHVRQVWKMEGCRILYQITFFLI